MLNKKSHPKYKELKKIESAPLIFNGLLGGIDE